MHTEQLLENSDECIELCYNVRDTLHATHHSASQRQGSSPSQAGKWRHRAHGRARHGRRLAHSYNSAKPSCGAMAGLPVGLWVFNSLFTSTKVGSILECPLSLPPGAWLMLCLTCSPGGGWGLTEGSRPASRAMTGAGSAWRPESGRSLLKRRPLALGRLLPPTKPPLLEPAPDAASHHTRSLSL